MAIVSAREAFHELVTTDAQMRALLGEKAPGRARWAWGWIAAEAEPAAFPQATFHLVTGELLGRDPRTLVMHQDAQLVTNLWAWPGDEASSQGIAFLEQVDQRLVELCGDGNVTVHPFNGVRVSYRAGDVRDFPDAPNAPVRISRPIFMGVS